MNEFYVNSKEKIYLRVLAQKYMEYTNLPVMEKRKNMWYEHNQLTSKVPMVLVEMGTFEGDMIPPLTCENPHAKAIEKKLLKGIIEHEMINDDKILSPYYTLDWDIKINEFQIVIPTKRAKDANGKEIGYIQEHPIKDLLRDFSLLKPSTYEVDKNHTLSMKNNIEEIFGDIMPVVIKNDSLSWHFTPTEKIVHLMGMENMLISMMDYPEEFHQLMKFINEDMFAYLKWQEKEGLLVLNNGNDYIGTASCGFTNELPSEQYRTTGAVTPKDIWVNINSQETVGISPNMYGEFIFPYYKEIAEKFGLVYYGCCEPVHGIWDNYLKKIKNIRKVSISPWCDEEYMGNALKGSGVIYSRKPNSNFVGVGKSLDEEGLRNNITKTLHAAQGCNVEIIFRDVYHLDGDKTKPGRAVNITRELIERHWKG